MSGKAVEDSKLAVWVVPYALRDGFAYSVNFFEVRFILNLEQVLLAQLVEINKSVSPECFQEISNVVEDSLKVLDALLDWRTFFLQLLQVFDLIAHDLPGGVELRGRECDHDHLIRYERVGHSEIQI